MAAPQIARLPPGFEMSDGMRIVVTAIDAATGSTVSGVTVANVSVDVRPLTGQTTPTVEFPDDAPWLVPAA